MTERAIFSDFMTSTWLSIAPESNVNSAIDADRAFWSFWLSIRMSVVAVYCGTATAQYARPNSAPAPAATPTTRAWRRAAAKQLIEIDRRRRCADPDVDVRSRILGLTDALQHFKIPESSNSPRNGGGKGPRLSVAGRMSQQASQRGFEGLADFPYL